MSLHQNSEKIMTILKGPHLSEKSHILAEKNQIAFLVCRSATKREIKKAVEVLFEVTVERVTVMNYSGKKKRHGSNLGQRRNWKKAYVRLAEGSQIDFLGAE
tara:strand:+ start:280 stop:585 length:306 start_codon:yes stop_codon:yes gene_type:complete